MPKGGDIPCLDQDKEWHFTPRPGLKVGDLVAPGDVLGFTFENDLFSDHKIMVPPKVYGKITELQPKANYNVQQSIATIEFEGKARELKMSHFWPVR